MAEPTPPITNRWVAAEGKVLFVHTSSYHSHVPMAGRERESQAIADLLSTPAKRVVIVSANLGAGKTFLLQRVFRELTKDDATPFNEAEQTVSVQANATVGGPYGFAEPDGNVLLIEELDRKLPYQRLVHALTVGASWLEEQREGTLILTGDRFLEHPAVLEILDRLDAERDVIGLDDLDHALLAEAIGLRIESQLGYRGSQRLAAAQEAAARLLADPWIARGLLPQTTDSVATFRDALAALDGLRTEIELTDEPCRLRVDALRGYTESGLPRRGLKHELEQALSNEIVRRARQQEQWRPLDIGDLIALIKDHAGDDEDYDPEDYREEVVEPLVTSGVLLPLGIPYFEGVSARISGPFLPTTRTFLRAFGKAATNLAASGAEA